MASTTPSSGPATSTIILATVGTLTAAAVGYAIWFDQKRRSDAEFRRSIKRAKKRLSQDEQKAAVQARESNRQRIRDAIKETKENSSMSPEEQETTFMRLVAEGEGMMNDPASDSTETAITFYKALKLYPSPAELMGIFDKTLNTQTRETLAEVIAMDSDFQLPGMGMGMGMGAGGPGASAGAGAGAGSAGNAYPISDFPGTSGRRPESSVGPGPAVE